MNFDFSEEQKMLADSASRYVRERCDLETRRKNARTDDGFSRQHWQHFAEQGWLAVTLPEAAGGLDMGMEDMAVLMEELGRGIIAEPIVDSAILGGSLIAESANTALQESILPTVAMGESILALAHMEQGARSEYETTVETTATPAGDGWTLDGVKHVVYYGNAATHLIVSAKISGQNDFSLFLVDADSDGLTKDIYELIDGTRAADISLNGVTVPAGNLIHEAESAANVLGDAMDKAVIAFGAALLGGMESVLVLTADYLKTREQYGQPLAKFQALKHRMSEMLVETEQARSALLRALSMITSQDPAERQHGVSAAKVLIYQSAHFVTAQGIQLHGGIGVTEEYAVGHLYKAVQVFDKRFGSSDFHLERCAH